MKGFGWEQRLILSLALYQSLASKRCLCLRVRVGLRAHRCVGLGRRSSGKALEKNLPLRLLVSFLRPYTQTMQKILKNKTREQQFGRTLIMGTSVQ